MSRVQLLSFALAAGLIAGPAASAATTGSYKGRTDQNRAVHFTVKGGKVRGFEAGVLTFCNTMGNNHFETDAIANLPAIPIRGSRFDLKREVEHDGQITVEVHGRFSGSKVTGKVTLRRPDSYYDASAGMTYFGACVANDRKFTARR